MRSALIVSFVLGVNIKDAREPLTSRSVSPMQRCKLKKVCGILRILRVNLACVDKFETQSGFSRHHRAHTGQRRLHPKMMEKILSHCREDVLVVQ